MRWNGKAIVRRRAPPRAPGCAPRPTRSRAAPAKCSSTWWPSASSACPEPEMTWVLDEQKRMLRDSAQTFLADRAPVSHLRALRDANDAAGYSAPLWRDFGQQGYSATLVPESLGGLGLGVTEAALIAEQIGHTLAPT